MPATHIALKKFTVGKVEYSADDPVDTSRWPFRRDILLEGQRFIKRLPPSTRSYTAARDFPLGDTTVLKGERIDSSSLPSAKLEQLVGLRYISVSDAPAP